MKLLEEFWYGNIEPTEYNTNACKEYKEVLCLITRNEEKLQATMTDEQKELFSRYIRNKTKPRIFLWFGFIMRKNLWFSKEDYCVLFSIFLICIIRSMPICISPHAVSSASICDFFNNIANFLHTMYQHLVNGK